jgi:hypothetical protein
VRAAPVALAAVLLLAAGCGGEDERASAPTPTPTATPTATPTPIATPSPDPTASAPSAPGPPPDGGIDEGHGVQDLREQGEDQEGGAGDEEEARTPVKLVLDAEGITPPSVEVPAFIALRVTVRNDLPRAARVRGLGVRFRVPARGRRTVKAGGVRPGRHTLSAGALGRATVVAK